MNETLMALLDSLSIGEELHVTSTPNFTWRVSLLTKDPNRTIHTQECVKSEDALDDALLVLLNRSNRNNRSS